MAVRRATAGSRGCRRSRSRRAARGRRRSRPAPSRGSGRPAGRGPRGRARPTRRPGRGRSRPSSTARSLTGSPRGSASSRSGGAGWSAGCDHERSLDHRTGLREPRSPAGRLWCSMTLGGGPGLDHLAQVGVDDQAGRGIDRVLRGAPARRPARARRCRAPRCRSRRPGRARSASSSRAPRGAAPLPGESHTRGSPPWAATTLRNTSSALPSASARCDPRARRRRRPRPRPPSTQHLGAERERSARGCRPGRRRAGPRSTRGSRARCRSCARSARPCRSARR